MSASFNTARESENQYHEQFYKENKLFEDGSWMSRPTPLVMELLERLLQYTPAPRVLDLACGVGRHAIPVAQKLEQGGEVVGVDLLEDAIKQLQQYASEYDVSDRVQAIVGDVEHYEIEPEQFDYMIATGCLEHVSSPQALHDVLQRMQAGTRTGGIHFISMTSSVQQVDQQNGNAEEGNIELNLNTTQLLELLESEYEGWNIIARKAVAQAIEENKDDREIELQGNWVTFAASKQPPSNEPKLLQQDEQTG
ncbi:class I SAM-dependent methyltransferase [Paenibacillus hunanensis]|uniref:class I SAM-dependent methyltransferase n=1 Tax=Paenibacillus hunanensis TaxID=539262 RepID=UPI002A6B558F|nr:class I SAM-dependent methyltransferase [Paenibacillus hunanensis]WPP39944.1 class I SAM-dependent methyltransferase [Paenibacillus hunanensis]